MGLGLNARLRQVYCHPADTGVLLQACLLVHTGRWKAALWNILAATWQLSWEDEGIRGPQPPPLQQPEQSHTGLLHLQLLEIFVEEMVQVV